MALSMFLGAGGFGEYSPIASAMGANVIAISRTQATLDKAMELGVVANLQAGEDVPEQIQEMTGGGVHVSLDCLGTAATWMPFILSLRTKGRLVRIGVSGQEEAGILPAG